MDKFKDVTLAQVLLLVSCVGAVVAAHFFAAGLTPTVMSLTAVVVMAFVRKFGDPPPPAPPAAPASPDQVSTSKAPGLAFRALAFAAITLAVACATVTAPDPSALVQHADKLLTCENQARAAADAAKDGAAGAATWEACKAEAGIQ